eukprot:8295840-Karenia_brevis.AAC.1
MLVRLPRAVDIYGAVAEELWQHAGIRINMGKTQVWNKAGERPDGIETGAACLVGQWSRRSGMP